MRQVVPVLLLAFGAVACADTPPPSEGGLVVTRDSTADSLFVTITGEVPAADVRQVVEELRIAPGMDDTTLFTTAWGFEVDANGRTWVFDQDTKAIFQFDATGELVRRIGRSGGGPGEFQSNNGIAVLPDGGIAQWDGQNGRLSFFDSAGSFVESWPIASGFGTSNGVVTDRTGRIYLHQPVTERTETDIHGRVGLVRLSPGGAFGDSLVPPDLGVEAVAYVARIEGRSSSARSRYGPQRHWAWHPDSGFVLGHGGTGDIVVTRASGVPLVIRRRASAVPVDADERTTEEQLITWWMRRMQPDWNWSGPALPTTKAPLTALQVAQDGRIWAQVPVESELIPAAERTPPRDSTMPVYRHRMPSVHEVFGGDGTLLGRVALPSGAWWMEARGDFIWALVTDENGLPAVVRYRVKPGFGDKR